MTENGHSHRAMSAMLYGDTTFSESCYNALKGGNFKVTSTDHANAVKDIILCLKENRVEFCRNAYLVHAISKIVMVKEINIDRLKRKIKSHAYTLKNELSTNKFLDAFENLYNRNVRCGEKIPLKWLANGNVYTKLSDDHTDINGTDES